MESTIRTWKLSDAPDLATALNNPNILKNLRDGLPYPYTISDAESFIHAMLGAEPGSQYAFTIDVSGKAVGSIAVFRQANIHFRTAELRVLRCRALLGARPRYRCSAANLQLCISKE